jgi:hypothetical protein
MLERHYILLLFRYRNHEPQPSLSFEALFVNPMIISSNTAPLFLHLILKTADPSQGICWLVLTKYLDLYEPFRSASARSAPATSRFAKLNEIKNY